MREVTKNKWAARVAAWRASGLTSSEFCRNKSYKPGSLHMWAHLDALCQALLARALVTNHLLHPFVHGRDRRCTAEQRKASFA